MAPPSARLLQSPRRCRRGAGHLFNALPLLDTSRFYKRHVSKPASVERLPSMRKLLPTTLRLRPARPAPSPVGDRWTVLAESVWVRRFDALGAAVPSPGRKPGGIRHDR
jgi:hypothetical protein